MEVLFIMLYIFSGRQNPTCEITSLNPEYQNIISRLSNPPGGIDLMLPGLGYQGFMVRNEGNGQRNYIPRFSNKALEKLLLNACPYDIGYLKDRLEDALQE